jgi:hypothetical protein
MTLNLIPTSAGKADFNTDVHHPEATSTLELLLTITVPKPRVSFSNRQRSSLYIHRGARELA